MGSLLGCSLAAILLASSGAASQSVETTLQDDAVLLHRSDEQVRRAARTIAELGADRVRITASWSVLAPHSRSRTKPPEPFDPEDSSTYPRAGFWALDRAIRAVTHEGLDVQLDLAFWAPRWAVKRAGAQPDRQRTMPNARDFAAFAKAVATRYSGGYADPRHGVGPLPAVRMYTTWNEPNYANFLQPQWVRTKRGYRPYSPHVYRAMHEAAYAAVKDVSRRNKVLIGGLSSTGYPVRGKGGVTPLEFTRTLACVDRALAPLRVPECRDAGVLHADGFAIHPYSVDVAPGVHAANPDEVFLADLDRLDTLLTQLYNRGRTDRQWPVYITEYGYETKPPDPTAQYTPEQQARYLGWSTYLAQSDPHVKMFAQFLLRDVDLRAGGRTDFNDYQTGLLFSDGRPKPAARAFKIPLFASYATAPDGSPGLVLYGGVRPGRGRQIVRVERRAPGAAEWTAVQTVGDSCDQDAAEFFTDGNGFFRRTAAWDGPGDYRLGWDHGGKLEYGAIVGVAEEALLPVGPPGGARILARGP